MVDSGIPADHSVAVAPDEWRNLSYDADRNMQGNGVNTFTWNARNQMGTLNGAGVQYDAFGRRIQNAAGTSFLYDRANAVQELSGTTVTANLLSGGVDEVFNRTDSSGAFAQLKDALGSTFALADANGNVQTSYTYDPFGKTSVTGTTNGNEFQYAGRENEGNGLYFYRARCYSPLLGRFISEDPMGFAAGMNSYRYVGDDPQNGSDPFGLAGGPINLGQGWTARVDAFNVQGQAASEIHVFDPSGTEVGIVQGPNGWIGKHGFPDNVRPPGIPDDVIDAINGVNINQLRAEGALAPKGQENITNSRYLRPGRTLGLLFPLTAVLDELAADITLARRAKSAKRSTHDQMCSEQFPFDGKMFLMTTFGPIESSAICGNGVMM